VSHRFAIYFAPPPGSELEAFGRRWLGRDHVSGEQVARPAIPGCAPDQLDAVTAFPRHYGFHATLKAPFELQPGCSAEELHRETSGFAAARRPFSCPALRVSGLSAFIALTLAEPSPEMQMLADDCVRAFERFRAPLPEDELARRRASGLTPRQDDYLVRFGYPYVFDDFHFHMTLTGPLEPPEHARMLKLLVDLAGPVTAAPLAVDAIAIYEQPDRTTPFSLTGRYPLSAG
jgi:putative phosphonate metabolism protein